MNRTAATVMTAVCVIGSACAPAQEAPVSKSGTENASASETGGELARLSTMKARFAPTEIAADRSRLAPAERQILARLVQASKIMDRLYLRQVWSGNEMMQADLRRDDSPLGRARLHYFLITRDRGRAWITTRCSCPGRRPNPRG